MFPIVNNLNMLATSVNGLRADVRQLQAAQQDQRHRRAPDDGEGKGGANGISALQQQHASLDDAFKRVSAQTVQTMQGLVDVRRHLDVMKAEFAREIGMLETVVLRKFEVAMHKMVSDKVAVAVDALRLGLKDKVLSEAQADIDGVRAEVEELRLRMDAPVPAATAASTTAIKPEPSMAGQWGLGSDDAVPTAADGVTGASAPHMAASEASSETHQTPLAAKGKGRRKADEKDDDGYDVTITQSVPGSKPRAAGGRATKATKRD